MRLNFASSGAEDLLHRFEIEHKLERDQQQRSATGAFSARTRTPLTMMVM